MRNLYKYSKIYGGSDPKLIEEDVFRIVVSIDGGLVGKSESGKATPQVTPQASDQATEQVTEQAVLSFCKEPKSTHEIMEYIGLRHREHFRSQILKPLIEKGLLGLTIPDKPNSPKQKYIAKSSV